MYGLSVATFHHEAAQEAGNILCAFGVFLRLQTFLSGALDFRDRVCLGKEGAAKRSEHFQQQIEFSQALTSRTDGAEKELELNPSTTISNRQHAVAPLVFTTATRFDFSENVRSVAC